MSDPGIRCLGGAWPRLVALLAVTSLRPAIAGEEEAYAKLDRLARVLHYVEDQYVESLPAGDLIDAAIEGLVARLDPFSIFLGPDAYRKYQAGQAASGFLGFDVALTAAGPQVRQVWGARLRGMRALAPGDEILAVDGQPVAKERLRGLDSLLRGPLGARRSVRFRHDGRTRVLALPIEARPHGPPTKRWLRPDVLVITLPRFLAGADETIRGWLQTDDTRRRLRALILDLRGNPGGLIDVAIRLADLWVERGAIVELSGRHEPPHEERAHPQGTEPGYPMVVLVDGQTASAAEILTGALQDHGRAVVVGQRTFGKGTVQTLIELGDGSALKLTVARYRTPRLRPIDGQGLSPDWATDQHARGDGPDADTALALRVTHAWRRAGAPPKAPSSSE